MTIIHPGGGRRDAEIYAEERKEPAEVSNTHSWSAIETEIELKSLASKPETSLQKFPGFYSC